MKLYKFYGPPGTGKTHRLISRVKAYARKGIPLHKIGYFAFTRKAAEEARKRIGANEKEIPYFQTLHSFAYHKLDLKEENIMQPYHYEDLGKSLGIRVNYVDKFNDELGLSMKVRNVAVKLIISSKERGFNTAGKDPKGIAAAAIYLGSKICNENRTQKEISKLAKVTEVTLRMRVKDLQKFAKIID